MTATTATANGTIQKKISTTLLYCLTYLPLVLSWYIPLQYSALLAAAAFYLYYEFVVCGPPLITTSNPRLRALLTRLPSMTTAYRPSPLYFEGRMQTVMGLRKRLPATHKINYDKRELLKLRDGGVLAIDYLNNVDLNGNISSRTILLLPGLTSSSQTSYVKSLVTELHENGYNLIVYNTRGLGGVPLVTPRWACGADCEDLYDAVVHIKSGLNGKIFVVGASFGGMLLSQLLLKYPDECGEVFTGAMAISTIFDMEKLLDSLERPYFNKYVLNQGVTMDILSRAKKFPTVMRSVPHKWNFEHACGARNLRELDERLTCPMFGYSNVQDYYTMATTFKRLKEIHIPFFVLNAEDDPMQPALDLREIGAMGTESNVAFITTRRGGHLGFLEGWWGCGTGHFMERVVVEVVGGFFDKLVELGFE